MLHRRLLFDKKANDDHETKLKQQCGGHFRSKTTIGKEMEIDYKGSHIYVRYHSCWPRYNQTTNMLCYQIFNAIECF